MHGGWFQNPALNEPGSLTWRVTLNDRMVVHLEGGVTATACEADNVVLAVVYCDGGFVDGDVVRPHVENDTNFSLVLQVRETIAGEDVLVGSLSISSWTLGILSGSCLSL